MKAATRAAGRERNVAVISIHAAREGGDADAVQHVIVGLAFQSTPPVKAATLYDCGYVEASIFQSTPPVKAATRDTYPSQIVNRAFQSTPPVKAATQ